MKVVDRQRMPRKQLIITDQFPYHVVARSNNKEWFYIPIAECWRVFEFLLVEVSLRFHFQTHAFVLINNHYHLIGTASEAFPIPKVMEWFQRSANRLINDRAGRINHVFGGPYKGSLITSENYFYHALRYVYQNPVRAGLVDRAESYSFSSLNSAKIPLVWPITGIECLIPKEQPEFLEYLNQRYSQA